MKFLIFCWHNTTNFNIMEREHTTQSVENDLWAQGRHGRTQAEPESQGQCPWSLPEQMLQHLALTIWIQFRAERARYGRGSGMGSSSGSGWLDLCPEKKRIEKGIWFVCSTGQRKDMCNSLLQADSGHFTLSCAINHREGPLHVCQEALRSQFIFLVGWTNSKCVCSTVCSVGSVTGN